MQCLGFRVQGLGFRVQGFGFRVSGVRRVLGLHTNIEHTPTLMSSMPPICEVPYRNIQC